MNDERIGGDLRARTRRFALQIIQTYASLPKTMQTQVLGRQMLRSGTSVGAHYREAHRSRSTAEFISKLEVGLQELDETDYWLELLCESGAAPSIRIGELRREVDELTAIFVASCKTAKTHQRS